MVGCQKGRGGFRRERLGEVVALSVLAFPGFQSDDLFRMIHSLGDDLCAQGVSERSDGMNNLHALGIFVHTGDE